MYVLAAGDSLSPPTSCWIDTRNGIAYVSEVVWLKAPEFGLKFISTHSLRAPLPPQLEDIEVVQHHLLRRGFALRGLAAGVPRG